jgi:hypothetical protein
LIFPDYKKAVRSNVHSGEQISNRRAVPFASASRPDASAV